jgi:hypothetical protein
MNHPGPDDVDIREAIASLEALEALGYDQKLEPEARIICRWLKAAMLEYGKPFRSA